MRIDTLTERLGTLATSDGGSVSDTWQLTLHPGFCRVTATTVEQYDDPASATAAAVSLVDELVGAEYVLAYQARIAAHSDEALDGKTPSSWRGHLEVGLREV